MPRITLGNKLYLYDLLSREVGVGKQTMLASVEEVLAADDIMPCDLDCADTRELLEALDEFVRLTVFKRGRVYATVLDQPQWNEVLERLASEAENPEKGNANVGGPKAWKRKKSKKDPRPAKPRPHGRPEVVEVEAEAEVEAVAVAEVAAVEVAEVEEEVEQVAEVTTANEEADESQEAAAELAVKSEAGQTAATEPSSEAKASPSADEPARKPRVRRRRHVVSSNEEKAVETGKAEDARQKAAAKEPEAPAAPEEAKPQEAEVPAETPAEKPKPEAEPVAKEEPEPETKPEPKPESKPEPSPAVVLPPTFFDPVPAPAPRGRWVLPSDFVDEVVVSNEALNGLYEQLPWDTNPIDLLSMSWEAAKEARTYTRDGGVISFELTLEAQVGEDGQDLPAEALVARIRPMRVTSAGKRWRLL